MISLLSFYLPHLLFLCPPLKETLITGAEFQLVHAPAAFHADRIAWRAVIYLNLVRSIRRQVFHFAFPRSSLIPS